MPDVYERIAESFIDASKAVEPLYPRLKPSPTTQYPFAKYFEEQMPREEEKEEEEEYKEPWTKKVPWFPKATESKPIAPGVRMTPEGKLWKEGIPLSIGEFDKETGEFKPAAWAKGLELAFLGPRAIGAGIREPFRTRPEAEKEFAKRSAELFSEMQEEIKAQRQKRGISPWGGEMQTLIKEISGKYEAKYGLVPAPASAVRAEASFREFEALPWYQQIAWELPAWIGLGAGGITATGLRGALAGPARAPAAAVRVPAQVARGALAPVAAVEAVPGIALKYGLVWPVKQVAVKGVGPALRKSFELALDRGLDKWLVRQGIRGDQAPKVVQWFMSKNQFWLFEQGKKNLLKKRAGRINVDQRAAMAAEETVAQAEPKLLEAVTGSGVRPAVAPPPAAVPAVPGVAPTPLRAPPAVAPLAVRPTVPPAAAPPTVPPKFAVEKPFVREVPITPPPVTPPPAPPVPKTLTERRAEIQTLLAQPAKNLPKGMSKIELRQELVSINKSLIPQEMKLRQTIMASAKAKSLPQSQYREIFKRIGGYRHLTDIRLEGLQRILPAIQKVTPVTIQGKKVVRPKTEVEISEQKADLIEKGFLSNKLYDDILKRLNLKTDKYVDTKSFITETEARAILKEMRNIETLAPLGELKFGKPTPVKYLTSQAYYAQILGVKPLTEPLELAKQNFDLVYRAMAQSIEGKLTEVNRVWKSKKGGELRDLLDKYEEAPDTLTPKQIELFNWFRNLNRTIIKGENEVRKALDLPEIPYRQAYVRHVPDQMAMEIMMGQHPIPPALDYWSQKLVAKKIYNPMEMQRQLSKDLEELFTRDLGEASKAMAFTGLKEINLAQPLKALSQQMGALSDVLPAPTKGWVTDYVNQVIKGQQTNFDAELNRLVTESGFGGIVNKVLSPFHKSLGRKPVTALSTAIGKGTIYAVLALPRPRLLRLMIRNMFQRTQEMALHGVTPILKSFLPDPQALKTLKEQSIFLKSYTGVEEWPSDLMGKFAKIPLAPYQWTAVLNADRGMSIAYYDYLKLFTNKKYSKLGWASPERTYTEAKGFLYPDEQKLMLSEMEWSTGATQYQYIAQGMPEIFRHKTLAPLTRLQSWWMNHIFRFHREAMHRILKGETTRGHKLPWSMRANYLKYLLLGGALLTAMGYESSYLKNVLPHNLSPVGQFVMGLWTYITADSDWQKNEGKYDMFNSWKAIVPGALAYDEFNQFWSGEKPLWQLFFYGREEEGAPPRKPTWGFLEDTSSLEKFIKDSEKEELFLEYDNIPSNTIELEAAKRHGTVRYSRSEYRKRFPEIDARLFISGRVSTITTPSAAILVMQIVKSEEIDPLEIKAVSRWQEEQEKRKELGIRDTTITDTDRLMQRLVSSQPTETPSAWEKITETRIPDLMRTPQSIPQAPSPVAPEAVAKWQAVRADLNVAMLRGLEGLWYRGESLPPQVEAALKRVHQKHSFGQPNFNAWSKQTLRQVFENAVMGSKK